METPVVAAVIGGLFVLLNTLVGAYVAKSAKQARDDIAAQGAILAKKYDEQSKVMLIEGETEAVSALKTLTLEEKSRVRGSLKRPGRLALSQLQSGAKQLPSNMG